MAAELRLFIAVDPTKSVTARIESFVGERRAQWPLRWMARQNYHLTLKFLGATPDSLVAPIVAALTEIARSEPEFTVQFTGLGVFPSSRAPRVLWVGVSDPGQGLSRLAAKMDQALGLLGIPAESREYKPHLTIAKMREGRLKLELTGLNPDFGESQVRELILYESRLSRQGSLYVPVARVPLKPA